MADAISIQELIDARTDAKTLEEAVNGDAVTTVLSRLGESYPTLANALSQIDGKLDSADAQIKQAITDLFQNGGLPAEPFETKAQMTSEGASLPDGQLAMVHNDTANNGLYVKTAGAWVKSAYDPASISENSLKKFLDNKSNTTLFDFVDNAGVTVMQIDAQEHLRLSNMNKSVQAAFTDINDALLELAPDKENVDGVPHFVFTSENNEELLSLYADGGLAPANMNGTIQDAINKISKRLDDKDVLQKYNKKYTQHPSSYTVNPLVRDKLVNANLYNANNSPLPLYMLPQNMDVGTEWVDSVFLINGSAADLSDKVQIDGYQPEYAEDIGVVHPQIWEFSEQVAGYKYWMSINPYTNQNENIELPFIYGTNNPELKDWELIPTFPTPFEEDPVDEGGSYRGFLSDSGFTYDVHTGDLIFFWRKSLFFRDENNAEVIKTTLRASRYNGKDWSEAYDLIPLADDYITGSNYRSMSIVYNPTDSLYYCYVMVDTGKLYYHTTTHLDGRPWSFAAPVTISGYNSNFFWHSEIKPVGNKLVFMANVQTTAGGLYIGYSSDFTNFHMREAKLNNNEVYVYKPSFLPFIDKDMQGHLKVAYTSAGNPKDLFITKTTNIDFGV